MANTKKLGKLAILKTDRLEDPIRPIPENVEPGDPVIIIYRTGEYEMLPATEIDNDGVIADNGRRRLFVHYEDIVVLKDDGERLEGIRAQETINAYFPERIKA